MIEPSIWDTPGGLGAKLALALFVLFGVLVVLTMQAVWPRWMPYMPALQNVVSTVLSAAVIGGAINAFYWPSLKGEASSERLYNAAVTASWIWFAEMLVAFALCTLGVCLMIFSSKQPARFTLAFLALALAVLGYWVALECGNTAVWLLAESTDSPSIDSGWSWLPYALAGTALLFGVVAGCIDYWERRHTRKMVGRY